MDDKLIHADTLARIAEAIRIKTNSAASISPGQMADRILLAGLGNMPAYHDLEARTVLDKIHRLRDAGNNLLVFGAIGDSHVNVGAEAEALTKTSARHGAFALESAGRWAGCQFLVNLGDNCWGGDLDTAADEAAAAYLDGCIAGIFGHMRSYRLVGECDRSADPEKVFRLNSIHNVFDVSAATEYRGFGYTDYPVRKVRLIVLNTADCYGSAAGYGMSYEQKDFLMKALDLSEKTDCGQWQILLLSHHPLDYPNDVRYNTAADVNAILSAYAGGSTVQIAVEGSYALAEGEDPNPWGSQLSYSYVGKNGARIIANIHGHIHNDCHGVMAGCNVTRICTPNTCFCRDDQYAAGQYTADVSYPKAENTAADTAATFYAVDLDNHTIHSFAYGAGTDRVIGYS